MMDQFQQGIIDRSLSDALDQIAFACCHVRCSFPSRHFFTFENLSGLYDDASSQGYMAKAPFSRGFAWLSFSIPRNELDQKNTFHGSSAHVVVAKQPARPADEARQSCLDRTWSVY